MTKLSEKLVKARTILTNNNINELKSNIQIFMPLYDEIKRNISRFTKDENHYLSFCADDITELAYLCKLVLNSFNQKINVNKMIKEIMKPDKIDNNFMQKFTQNYADIFYIVARLTEFHSVCCYLASLLYVLEIQYQQGELEYVIIDVIKEFLK